MTLSLARGQKVKSYRIVERLGEGGMGVVYRAEDPRLGREVALKFLSDETAMDSHAVERFRREARAAASLNHPNLCSVYDVGEHQGRHFIVMELLEGPTLDECIDGRALPHDRILKLALQIAEGVEAAHAKGVVHRDLKPGNVFISNREQAKVADFGLAKFIPLAEGETPGRSVSATHAVVGTFPYMAPEQLRGEPVDTRTDVYALGVILYEMSTGQRPYRERLLPRLTDEILNSAPALPRSLNPAVDPRLQAIILKCLEKQPDRRYSSASALLVDLRALQAGSEASVTDSRPIKMRVTLSLILLAGLAGLVAALFVPWGRPPEPRPIDSLAVLPLENLSGDTEQEFFTDGMTEALIANLSRIQSLRVISRTSAMRYRDSTKSLPEIARELDVDAVVEGSVLRSGGRVRITVQLIEAATDHHLWAESYEGDLGDVLTLQSNVARAIAKEVELTLNDAPALSLTHQVRPEAYEAYLKGRYFWNRRNVESIKLAIEHFESATRLDPDYAPSWAGLADCYLLLTAIPLSELPARQGLPKVHEAGTRALELDPNLAEALASLAYERLWSWDFDASEKTFERAIASNPNYATAHFWYAVRLAAEKRFDESLAEAMIAQRLDPVSPILKAGVSWMHHFARRFDEEVHWARETLLLEPSFLIGRYRLAEGLLHGGNHAEAVVEFEAALELSGGTPDLLAQLGHAYALVGRRDDARKVIAQLSELSRSRFVPAFDMALVYMSLGDLDPAFSWLDRAVDEGGWGLPHMSVEVDFDPVRSDPRFVKLRERVGLAPVPVIPSSRGTEPTPSLPVR